MEPDQIPQGADPIHSTACVDAKRLRYSSTPANPVSIVLDGNYASSRPRMGQPLDNIDILEEIFLRLPLKPSSLPRASLVCKSWRRIISEPQFLKQFRKHHRKPPLLGFFIRNTGTNRNFVPIMDTKPDCIAAERFTFPKNNCCYEHLDFFGCRHGLAVLFNEWGSEVVVWDPLTGQQHCVLFPSALCNASRKSLWPRNAAVLCTDAEDGHVHGDCFSSPFRLVLIFSDRYTNLFACLYESASGVWGNVVSLTTNLVLSLSPSILIGNAVYWSFNGGDTLVFDIETQTLDVIKKPEDTHIKDYWSFRLFRTNDASGLGFADLSKLNIRLWERKINSDGVAKWVLRHKIIQMQGIFPMEMDSARKIVAMVGYDEESNEIVLATNVGDFMLQLDSMQFRSISKRNCWLNRIHYPYRNFYTAGGRMMHNTL